MRFLTTIKLFNIAPLRITLFCLSGTFSEFCPKIKPKLLLENKNLNSFRLHLYAKMTFLASILLFLSSASCQSSCSVINLNLPEKGLSDMLAFNLFDDILNFGKSILVIMGLSKNRITSEKL